jgi:hypothetical protein
MKPKESILRMAGIETSKKEKRNVMAELNPERNLRIVLIISGAALVTGAVTGGVGFAILGAEEHIGLGMRTGALLSQTLVWGGVIVVGLGHWVYEGYKALRGELSGERSPSEAELTLAVDPNQIERPLASSEGTAVQRQAGAETATGAAVAKSRDGRYQEVSV